MRVLVVTNMWPTRVNPERGIFVRDQVEALRARGDVEVDVFALRTGPRGLARSLADVRRRVAGRRYDVVHAHFGLSAYPAVVARAGPVAVTLHGTDIFHPRTRQLTRAILPFCALVSAASGPFAGALPGAGRRRRVAVLPVGVSLARFRPIPRVEARARLGLDPDGRYLLFPHDPARVDKGVDRAREAAGPVQLLTLGRVPPDEVPYWINAANAVLVPSHRESFGLSVLEALACRVPVVATPVGNHPFALAGIAGTLCAPWEPAAWRAALAPHLDDPDPRVDGRDRAALFSTERMAARVVAAWRAVAGAQDPHAPGSPSYTRPIGGPRDQAPVRP